MQKIARYLLQDKILVVAVSCACIGLTCGRPQMSDINWSTIENLFSLMVCVQILQSFQILNTFSSQMLHHSANTRQICRLFILLAFFSAMFLTNDVAILTLVPMFINLAQQQKIETAYPLTLIVIAANLGSALTLMGNPQNLFLINFYHLNITTFFQLAAPLAGASFILLMFFCTFLPNQPIITHHRNKKVIKWPAWLLAGGLIVINLGGIFYLVPKQMAVIVTVICGWIIDRQIYQRLDYALLLTFVCFFIFVSELNHNQAITQAIQALIQSPAAVYLLGLITSQFISNVPTVILLAKFTQAVPALFLGVNIGGLGSIVASLANLLALKQLIQLNKTTQIRVFIKVFTWVNFLSLLILGILGFFYLQWR